MFAYYKLPYVTAVIFEVNGEGIDYPLNGAGTTEFPYVKIKLDYNTICYTESISGELKNIKIENFKPLEENTGEYLYDFKVGEEI